MAEAKTQASAPTAQKSTPREVLAQRMKNAEEAGVMTPKLQREFDRMAANIVKGNK